MHNARALSLVWQGSQRAAAGELGALAERGGVRWPEPACRVDAAPRGRALAGASRRAVRVRPRGYPTNRRTRCCHDEQSDEDTPTHPGALRPAGAPRPAPTNRVSRGEMFGRRSSAAQLASCSARAAGTQGTDAVKGNPRARVHTPCGECAGTTNVPPSARIPTRSSGYWVGIGCGLAPLSHSQYTPSRHI